MLFDTFLLLLLTCLDLSQPLPSIAITSAESRIIFSHIFCLKIQSYSKVILLFCLKALPMCCKIVRAILALPKNDVRTMENCARSAFTSTFNEQVTKI